MQPASSRTVAYAADKLLELSAVSRARLVDQNDEPVGRVDDVIVRLADGDYPPVTGLQAQIGGRELFVPVGALGTLLADRVQLATPSVDLRRFQRRQGEVLLREDVLDRKLIDVTRGRLIHANDLVLASVGGTWRLIGVDPSRSGIFRRLLPLRMLRPSPIAAAHPSFVDWHDVEPFVGHVPAARLFLPLLRLKRMHPAQIADLVERSTHDQGEEIIAAVGGDPAFAADVFEELDTEHQVEFLSDRSDEEAAQVLADMAPDDATDLLTELEQDRRQAVLDRVPSPQGEKLRELLRYNADTAGGMMSPDFIAVPQGTSTDLALQKVRAASGVPVQLLGNVFVVDDDGRFAGAIAVVDLVRAGAIQAVDGLEQVSTVHVRADADLQDVALVMADYNLTAVAVEESDGRLVGAISVDDVLEALVPDDWRRRAENASN